MIPITDLFRYAVIAFPLLVGIACSAKAIRIFRSNLVESGNVWATLKSHNRGALWLFSIGIIEGVSFVLNVLTYRSVKSNFLRVQSGLMAFAITGWYLAHLKGKDRRLYGLLELMTACAVATGVLLHISDEISPYEAVALCSALYLFVRAFDNLNEAKMLKRKALEQTDTV